MNEIKSQICLKQVNFLRFAINQSRLKLKSAKNVNELKSFIELITFLRKFIKECANLTAPLFDLKILKHLWGMTYVKMILES